MHCCVQYFTEKVPKAMDMGMGQMTPRLAALLDRCFNLDPLKRPKAEELVQV